MRIDVELCGDVFLPTLDNVIICPFSEDDGCPGTMIQTGEVGIIECNECAAQFELWQHGIDEDE
jgi:hypothetical protein